MIVRNIGPIPAKFSEAKLRELFLAVQHAFGTLRDDGSGRLAEHHIPMVLLANDTATTSTEFVQCSGFWRWNPALYPGGQWFLEATISISIAEQTVFVRLAGAGEVGVIQHTGVTGPTLVRGVIPLTMPATVDTLRVEYRTSAGIATASLRSAGLVFVPTQ